jgi:undecaprenyl-diphosphatase
MPTMAGAFAYDIYKSGAQFSNDNIIIIAIGFVTSFIFGWIVVKTFLDYVQRHGFGLFAWWRIVVGIVALAFLAAGK